MLSSNIMMPLPILGKPISLEAQTMPSLSTPRSVANLISKSAGSVAPIIATATNSASTTLAAPHTI